MDTINLSQDIFNIVKTLPEQQQQEAKIFVESLQQKAQHQEANPTLTKIGGSTKIVGTRLNLVHIIDYLKADWPPKLIAQWLNLTDKQLHDIMDYINTYQNEAEAEYEEALKLAEESRRYWEEVNKERFAKIATSPVPPKNAAIRARIEERKKTLGMNDYHLYNVLIEKNVLPV